SGAGDLAACDLAPRPRKRVSRGPATEEEARDRARLPRSGSGARAGRRPDPRLSAPPHGGRTRRGPSPVPRAASRALRLLVSSEARTPGVESGSAPLDVFPPPRDPGLPEPGQDRAAQSVAARGARRALRPQTAPARIPAHRSAHVPPRSSRRDALLSSLPR